MISAVPPTRMMTEAAVWSLNHEKWTSNEPDALRNSHA